MTVKILHTSDWHLGKFLEHINRINEQKEFIDELCNIVEQENIDLVLIAGDIFDTYNPSSAAEELFYEAVDRLNDKGKRGVVVIAGNHDSPERLCAASPLAYKNGIVLLGYPGSDAGTYGIKNNNIQIVDSGQGWLELNIEGCKDHAVIITLPYPSESRLEQMVSSEIDEEKQQQAYSDKIGTILANLSQKFRKDTVNLVISHIFIKGGETSESERTLQVGGAMTVDPAVLPGNAHYIALGHLHRPQQVKYAPSPTYYSGSPLAYSFSETGYSKVVYVIDAVADSEANIKKIYLNSGKPLVRWVAKNGIQQAFQWCEEGRDANAWIDLEIYTDRILTMEEQKQLRQLNPGIINIRPKLTAEDREIEGYENRETKSIDVLFQEYYKYRVGMEVSEELMNTFLSVIYEEESEETELMADMDEQFLPPPASKRQTNPQGDDKDEAKIS
ncbi:MAG: repair protein SbcD/Mre11 [Clostridiales bacterium]|jgi:exonuclease SbcD|nr:repair protein SbcD/Mre11 [Clostridiales bacterium]